MIHEDPLAYLLGLEGLALLRGFLGELDRDEVEARIAEVRRLLDDERLVDAAVQVDRLDTVAGYRIWSQTYDTANSAFDLDEPLVSEIVAGLDPGTALDAACGTGRHAALLAERGHRVIGVDSSPEMLARARDRVPAAEFRLGDLHRLPVADAAVDLVVCALALTHVPALAPVFAEFARVLRPGGHLVVADIHPEHVLRGSVPTLRGPDGRPARPVTYRHPLGEYLRAALDVDLELRRCEEPRVEPGPPRPRPATDEALARWEVWPWILAEVVPEAARAANAGVPGLVVWHFRAAAASGSTPAG